VCVWGTERENNTFIGRMTVWNYFLAECASVYACTVHIGEMFLNCCLGWRWNFRQIKERR